MSHARAFHQAGIRQNHTRLMPGFPLEFQDWQQAAAVESSFCVDEEQWIAGERAEIREKAAQAPREAEAFCRWFEDLKACGPGQNDPLFPWLQHTARADQMRWFLKQEVAGEAGFDDLVAMTQVKLPTRAKLEMARNYWDEMGRGSERGMHGPMLHRLAVELAIEPVTPANESQIVTESLALANLMAAFAYHRRYAYHSVGALGVIELTAPGRAAQVYEGLKRLNISAPGRQYYLLHSTLDVKHSEAWNREVLIPLVSEMPDTAPWIAEGALMRLEMGRRCFERYRSEFARMAQAVDAVSIAHWSF